MASHFPGGQGSQDYPVRKINIDVRDRHMDLTRVWLETGT